LYAVRRTVSRRVLVVLAIVVASLVGPLVAATSPHLHKTLLRFLQHFLVGFLLADLLVLDRLRPARRRLRWDVLALATTIGGMCSSIYLLHNVRVAS
jgi:peptidoglycan/LPS O-acetylase OafA/YrhL